MLWVYVDQNLLINEPITIQLTKTRIFGGTDI